MERVPTGHPSKNIAANVFINQRNVENYCASILNKTGSISLSSLARLVFAAA
jgi:FixJ family two-component response regulator